MTFATYFTYDKTGLITQAQTTHEVVESEMMHPEGGGILKSPQMDRVTMQFLNENFVENGEIKPRESMMIQVSKNAITANGEDELTISGIPQGAIVIVSGCVQAGPETINDGEIVLTSTTPGAFWVSIKKTPTHIDWKVNLNAT